MVEIVDVLCIGNYTKDRIITQNGSRVVDGGAFNYGANVAARMSLKTAVITNLATEDRQILNPLENLGVICQPGLGEFSTILQLLYPTDNPDERILTVEKVACPIQPSQVLKFKSRLTLVGASFRGEVPFQTLIELRNRCDYLGLDAQGYLRVLQDGKLIYTEWPEMSEIFNLIDYLKVDAVEAACITGTENIYDSARLLNGLGPNEVILTHKNGVLVYSDGYFYEAPFRVGKILGRSGRGDTCLSAYTCARLKMDVESSTKWAAAVTSLKMEKPMPFDRTMEEVQKFIRDNYD